MFTGIIESVGKIEEIEKEGSNVHFIISSPISNELKIDEWIIYELQFIPKILKKNAFK